MKIIIALLLVASLFVSSAVSENGDIYTAIGSIARLFGAGQIAVYSEPSDAYDPMFMLDEKTEVTVIGENAEGYTLINVHGESGYVKSEYIDMSAGIGGLSIYSGLSDEAKLQLNRFITMFTETDLAYYGQGVFDVNETTDEILNRCALDYMMLKGDAETEYGDFEDGNNLKITGTPDIAEFVRSVFGVTPTTPEAAYYTYADGAYYTEITNDLFRGDFAIVTNVIDMQDGTYEIRFSGFGMGYGWDEASLEMSEDEARAAYGDFPGTAGYALISADDIDDPATYRLIKLVTAR